MRQSFKRDDPSVIVPVASMGSILDALPPSLPLWFLKTDMQGEDAKAVRSAGEAALHVSRCSLGLRAPSHRRPSAVARRLTLRSHRTPQARRSGARTTS